MSNAKEYGGTKRKKRLVPRDNFCARHVLQKLYKGRVCPRCHPNCTVLGITRQDIIRASQKPHSPCFEYLYSIVNGTPSVENVPIEPNIHHNGMSYTFDVYFSMFLINIAT